MKTTKEKFEVAERVPGDGASSRSRVPLCFSFRCPSPNQQHTCNDKQQREGCMNCWGVTELRFTVTDTLCAPPCWNGPLVVYTHTVRGSVAQLLRQTSPVEACSSLNAFCFTQTVLGTPASDTHRVFLPGTTDTQNLGVTDSWCSLMIKPQAAPTQCRCFPFPQSREETQRPARRGEGERDGSKGRF